MTDLVIRFDADLHALQLKLTRTIEERDIAAYDAAHGDAVSVKRATDELAAIEEEIADLRRKIDRTESARREAIRRQGAEAVAARRAEAEAARVRAVKAAVQRAKLGKNLDELFVQLGSLLTEWQALTETINSNAHCVAENVTESSSERHKLLEPTHRMLRGSTAAALSTAAFNAGMGRIGILSEFIDIYDPRCSLGLEDSAKFTADRIAQWLDGMLQRSVKGRAHVG